MRHTIPGNLISGNYFGSLISPHCTVCRPPPAFPPHEATGLVLVLSTKSLFEPYTYTIRLHDLPELSHKLKASACMDNMHVRC